MVIDSTSAFKGRPGEDGPHVAFQCYVVRLWLDYWNFGRFDVHSIIIIPIPYRA